ncbi:hypothetical protein [Pseudomonas amygdali]|uniref:Uncharacterized protein n=2 Tax=Pseudomonas amygdali TaxID=47877 RepID=A0AAD0VA11_PSEAV|nr:hypothetical protein [Pseudomonas amygdali]AXH59994.1 hypothetical protein PLA107_032735 [Pseudomonas amygdali pv. lachrymans str. M301315]
MDFLVIKKPGHGVITSLTEELGKQQVGTPITLNLAVADGYAVGQIMNEGVARAEGKPMTILLDISDIDATSFMEPVLDVVLSRRIGGVSLPEKSTVVVIMGEQADIIPMPLALRTIRVDLAVPEFNASDSLAEMPPKTNWVRTAQMDLKAAGIEVQQGVDMRESDMNRVRASIQAAISKMAASIEDMQNGSDGSSHQPKGLGDLGLG